jgi:hypothetical protein
VSFISVLWNLYRWVNTKAYAELMIQIIKCNSIRQGCVNGLRTPNACGKKMFLSGGSYPMQTDFASVRSLLERALTHVNGADKTSAQVREALELLIEAALHAEYAPANVVPLTSRRSSSER